MSIWKEAYDEVNEYWFLQEGWDSYDAAPLSEDVIDRSLNLVLFLWHFCAIGGIEIGSVFPAPGADGSVDVELEHKYRTVIFTFEESGEFSIYKEDNEVQEFGLQEEETIEYSDEKVVATVQWLLKNS